MMNAATALIFSGSPWPEIGKTRGCGTEPALLSVDLATFKPRRNADFSRRIDLDMTAVPVTHGFKGALRWSPTPRPDCASNPLLSRHPSLPASLHCCSLLSRAAPSHRL